MPGSSPPTAPKNSCGNRSRMTTARNCLRGASTKWGRHEQENAQCRMQNPEEAADARLHSAFCTLHSRQPRRRAMIRRFARPYARAINDVMRVTGRIITLEQAEVPAVVRAAQQPTSAELEELQRTLEKKTGRNVEVEVRVDPSLLGGFVAKIGSDVYDASVAGKINKFRESLG